MRRVHQLANSNLPCESTLALDCQPAADFTNRMNPRVRFKLHFGPYKTPRFKCGDIVCDESREDVTIVGLTDAPNSLADWGSGPKGMRTIVLYKGLVRAVRMEPITAIRHWWGVTHTPVYRWRTPWESAASMMERFVCTRQMQNRPRCGERWRWSMTTCVIPAEWQRSSRFTLGVQNRPTFQKRCSRRVKGKNCHANIARKSAKVASQRGDSDSAELKSSGRRRRMLRCLRFRSLNSSSERVGLVRLRRKELWLQNNL
jgi:hypothetical protein